MNKAEMMERFVVKAGFAEPEQATEMVRNYKAAPDSRTLTFGEWAVMSNSLTPDQARTVLDFFDHSRFQCLECGRNVYGREFEERLVMICPHCSSREFQLRGTARTGDGPAATTKTKTRKAPGPPPGDNAEGESSTTQHITAMIDGAKMAETQTISRAPKLPGSGEAHTGVRVVDRDEAKQQPPEPERKRSVPLEALQILKGRSIDEFLEHLDRYPLHEWSAAMTLIARLERRDLVPAALEDGKRRLADLALLSLLTRSMPRLATTVQAFLFELVQETAVGLARLGAFLAGQEDALERPLTLAATAQGGGRFIDAQAALFKSMAAEVSEALEFFLTEPNALRILSKLQQRYATLPEEIEAKLREFLEDPEPFVRALIAYSAMDAHSPIRTEVLEAAIHEESNPFVTSTLQAALDRRHEVASQGISTFERVLILKRTPLFSSLSRDNLINVAGVANERHAAAGETIFLQDTPGEAAYILVDGHVDVVRTDREGNEHHLATLSAPQVFGEMAILN